MDQSVPELLAIGSPGQLLRVELLGPHDADALDPSSRGWCDAAIHVDAHPFTGTILTVLTEEEIVQCRQGVAEFSTRGHARLGGGRAAEITLVRYLILLDEIAHGGVGQT